LTSSIDQRYCSVMDRAQTLYLVLAKAIEQADSIPPCQDTDPEIWFGEIGDSYSSNMARKLCNTCPVINECLQYALESCEPFGVWGGMTAKERQKMRGLGRGRPVRV
jgi:WhiB family transcriptional regulator, redox-sensing transcriptional regulator